MEPKDLGTSAAVQLFDAKGLAAGWGPTDDPEGVKFTNATATDTYTLTTIPPGISVLPYAGGSFVLAVAATVLTGMYQFGYVRNGVSVFKAFAVT